MTPEQASRQIKVYVDTNRVESWPEIDAVELVGTDGTRQWAKESSASSSYSELYGGSAQVQATLDSLVAPAITSVPDNRSGGTGGVVK